MALEAPAPVPGADAQPDDHGAALAEPVAGAPLSYGTPTPPDGDQKVTRVVSAEASLVRRVGEIWASRELLSNLVRTEIKVKYKNSFLGLVWSMVAPAMTLVIFFFVFQVILKNGMPHFVIFLFSGLLIWNFFQTSVQAGTGVVVNNAGLVKKVSFPREILALAAVGSAGVFFFFQAIVMVIFLVVLHTTPEWSMLPVLVLALLAGTVLAAALSVLLSAINVYLRDTQHLVEVLLTAWFWACPIVYAYWRTVAKPLHQHGLTWLYFLNPVTPLVMTFQRVLYNIPVGHLTTKPFTKVRFLPPWPPSTYVLADLAVLGFAVVLFVVALVVFGRLEGNFAEEL
ncbi:MAG TPA: ABC transporter permease [Acidimicrobiales bacterium]|nr:ABC transporter permease [Acidimicrobiales bacterium]